MKTFLSICFFSILFFSCAKNSPGIYNEGVLGKWELVEYFISPGDGSQHWQTPDESLKHTLEFKSNEDFITDADMYYQATAYEIPDSTYIKFLNASAQVNGSFEYGYSLQEKNSILIISPQCYEGCAYKYKAAN